MLLAKISYGILLEALTPFLATVAFSLAIFGIFTVLILIAEAIKRRKKNMPKWVSDILAITYVVVTLVIVNEQPGNGTAKKEAVINEINKKLDEPGGLDRPSFISKSLLDWILGMLIDAVVARFNSLGVFGKSNA